MVERCRRLFNMTDDKLAHFSSFIERLIDNTVTISVVLQSWGRDGDGGFVDKITTEGQNMKRTIQDSTSCVLADLRGSVVFTVTICCCCYCCCYTSIYFVPFFPTKPLACLLANNYNYLQWLVGWLVGGVGGVFVRSCSTLLLFYTKQSVAFLTTDVACWQKQVDNGVVV
ncbi:hypothetical protein T08_14835 [Trichinella sp. T8]|nr:hypothetical protein T08_14835 [Trichinella sp. T8]